MKNKNGLSGNVDPQENEKYMSEYLTFHLTNVEPKIQEIFFAETKKERRRIQREIVAIIKDAGYTLEATQMKAMFNL